MGISKVECDTHSEVVCDERVGDVSWLQDASFREPHCPGGRRVGAELHREGQLLPRHSSKGLVGRVNCWSPCNKMQK